jgi:hypothetical protein
MKTVTVDRPPEQMAALAALWKELEQAEAEAQKVRDKIRAFLAGNPPTFTPTEIVVTVSGCGTRIRTVKTIPGATVALLKAKVLPGTPSRDEFQTFKHGAENDLLVHDETVLEDGAAYSFAPRAING